MKETETVKNDVLCPSYICKPGSHLYGVVNANGFIDYLTATIQINEAFVEEAIKGRTPEKRFRFAGNCAKSGCKQWAGQKQECGLVNEIIDIVGKAEPVDLQDCAIRPQCRWYAQRKGLACAQCNEVIRNIEAKMIEIN